MSVGVSLAVVAADYRVASTRWRAALALDDDARRALAAELAEQGGHGLAALATCNRTAWIASGEDARWMAQLLSAAAAERLSAIGPEPPRCRVYVGVDAARHLLRVAAGLDSLVVGERQIGGQLLAALGAQRGDGQGDGVLNIVANHVGRLHRRLRGTSLGARGRGVHTLVRDVLTERLGAGVHRIGVLGAGAIGRDVANTLRKAGHSVQLVNRSPRRGALPWDQLPRVLDESDGLVVCTGARAPVLRELPEGPRVVIDIGSPAQVAGIPGVIGIDELVGLAQGEADARALREAEALVESELSALIAALAKHRAQRLVHQVQASLRDILDARLPAVLDAHAASLPGADRRALEVALRALVRDQARVIREVVEQESGWEGGRWAS